MSGVRADHLAIASRVPAGVRVLDVGCGDGALLSLLRTEKGADARGLELVSEDAGRALARGVSVIQGDAEADLGLFPDNGFDIAILSRAIQQMRRPASVLAELRRIAPDVIISFTNFGYWRRRLALMWDGRMPMDGHWFEDDALHPCSVTDMMELARNTGLGLVAAASVSHGQIGAFGANGIGGLNWRADEVILHLRRE